MAYESRLALVDDVSKQMKRMQKGMDGTLDITKDLQDNLDELPRSVKRMGNETERTEKKAKGLLREVNSINKTMRRTTALFGAAFGIGQISQFTNEVVESEQQVANLFGVTGNELKMLNADATRLATVYGLDVTEGIEAANTVAKQFGISGSESFSLIEQALSKGVSKDFLGDIENLAPSFQQAGLGAENMIALMAQGQRAGVGDELAKSYAEAIDRLGSMSGDGTINALEMIGLSPKKIKESLDSGKASINDVIQEVVSKIVKENPASIVGQQAIEGIFGGSANTILNNFGLLQEGLGMSLQFVEDRTTDATRAQQYLFGAWADFKVLIAENVVPVLANVVGWVRENQESLLYWGSLALKVAGAFTGIWLAAKSIMLIKGMVMSISAGFTILSNTMKIAQGVTLLFNAALWANPITWVVGGIVALGAAIYGIITYWEDIKGYLWNVAQFLWENNPIAWMIYAIDYVFPGFKDALQGLWDWTGEVANGMWYAFHHVFIRPLVEAFDWITSWFYTTNGEADKLNNKVQGTANTAGQDGPGLSLFKEVNDAVSKIAGTNNDNLLPGMDGNTSLNLAGQMKQPKGMGGNMGISAGIAGVQSEGPKAQNLTINITKLVESLNINTTTLKESAGKIKEEIAKALLAAVNDVNASVG